MIKKQIKNLIYSILVFLFFSCNNFSSNQKPNNLIDEETMEKILFEAIMMDVMNTFSEKNPDFLRLFGVNYLYQKYGENLNFEQNEYFRDDLEELKQLKTTKESQMRISDIVSEEITLEDTQDFHEEFDYLAFSEDEGDLFEAEYQGRTVKLNKPMQGDVKKFKVYVKNDKGNVVKVNFGDPNMRIKKSNPARRKSFRARHNCDNPGPKTKARYWSCRKW